MKTGIREQKIISILESRGESSDQQLYQKISDTLTILASGGEVK